MKLVLICLVGLMLFAKERTFMITGEEFPPYEYVVNGKVVGIDIDIVDAIFKRLNTPYEVRLYPWARAWRMAELGRVDAVLSTSRKDSREPYVYYPDEYMWSSEFVFFTLKEKKLSDFRGYDDIKKHSLVVGIIRGNSYHESFWRAFPPRASNDTEHHPLLDLAVDAESNFKKLMAGRIDLFLIPKTIGLRLISQLGYEKEVTYYDRVMFSKKYPMVFTKKSDYPNMTDFMKRFTEELRRIKQSGEYEKIFERWMKK